MRFWTPALTLALAFAAPASCADALGRYLLSLKLGDTIKEIESVYPPKKKWRKYREPGGQVDRILMEAGSAKWFPAKVEELRLGISRGVLVHLQIVYKKEYSQQKPVGELVRDYSLIYGEPRRYGEVYFWWDAQTVLAVSNAEVKTTEGVELRTGLELMEKSYFAGFRN